MNIYVSAMMRSGSSHLVRSMGKLFNHRVSSPRFGFAGRYSTDDHQIDHMMVSVMNLEGDYILHQHSKATGNNVYILKSFGYTPIVLFRKLYDCLVSVYDQMPASDNMTVPGTQRPEWNSMTDSQQWLWMAYQVVPWYLTYYASWHYTDINKYVVWYEDYYKDQVKGMRKILEFLKVQDNVTDDMMDKVVNMKDNSFHVGLTGRGEKVPAYVKEIAEKSIESWGPLAKKMKKELL